MNEILIVHYFYRIISIVIDFLLSEICQIHINHLLYELSYHMII